jgi:hypothetical protein
MTGFAALPLASEEGDVSSRKFKGVARIMGPHWMHLPTLTVGLLGVQVFWSVEMSYGMLKWSRQVQLYSKVLSITISLVLGIDKVQHGYRLPGRAALWAHHAAVDWCVHTSMIRLWHQPLLQEYWQTTRPLDLGGGDLISWSAQSYA